MNNIKQVKRQYRYLVTLYLVGGTLMLAGGIRYSTLNNDRDGLMLYLFCSILFYIASGVYYVQGRKNKKQMTVLKNQDD